jgi:hypothetical protein
MINRADQLPSRARHPALVVERRYPDSFGAIGSA